MAERQQFSDLPPGAQVVSAPTYSDLPPGATVATDTMPDFSGVTGGTSMAAPPQPKSWWETPSIPMAALNAIPGGSLFQEIHPIDALGAALSGNYQKAQQALEGPPKISPKEFGERLPGAAAVVASSLLPLAAPVAPEVAAATAGGLRTYLMAGLRDLPALTALFGAGGAAGKAVEIGAQEAVGAPEAPPTVGAAASQVVGETERQAAFGAVAHTLGTTVTAPVSIGLQRYGPTVAGAVGDLADRLGLPQAAETVMQKLALRSLLGRFIAGAGEAKGLAAARGAVEEAVEPEAAGAMGFGGLAGPKPTQTTADYVSQVLKDAEQPAAIRGVSADQAALAAEQGFVSPERLALQLGKAETTASAEASEAMAKASTKAAQQEVLGKVAAGRQQAEQDIKQTVLTLAQQDLTPQESGLLHQGAIAAGMERATAESKLLYETSAELNQGAMADTTKIPMMLEQAYATANQQQRDLLDKFFADNEQYLAVGTGPAGTKRVFMPQSLPYEAVLHMQQSIAQAMPKLGTKVLGGNATQGMAKYVWGELADTVKNSLQGDGRNAFEAATSYYRTLSDTFKRGVVPKLVAANPDKFVQTLLSGYRDRSQAIVPIQSLKRAIFWDAIAPEDQLAAQQAWNRIGASYMQDILLEGGTKNLAKNLAALPRDVAKELYGSLEGQIAFHGSAADFSQFDINKVGFGGHIESVGAPGMAGTRGWGLYFTDNPEVAEIYREILGSKVPVYKARIAPGQYMEWDKPWTEQAPTVQNAVGSLVKQHFGPDYQSLDGWTDLNALRDKLGDRGLSKALLSKGVDGVRYAPTETGTVAGPATNYVLFDDRGIRILSKKQEIEEKIGDFALQNLKTIASGLEELKAAEKGVKAVTGPPAPPPTITRYQMGVTQGPTPMLDKLKMVGDIIADRAKLPSYGFGATSLLSGLGYWAAHMAGWPFVIGAEAGWEVISSMIVGAMYHREAAINLSQFFRTIAKAEAPQIIPAVEQFLYGGGKATGLPIGPPSLQQQQQAGGPPQ